ncbi:MAG: TonB-dependent receptor plug domain-containing protein, partial [Bdellovibrionota bacterium]
MLLTLSYFINSYAVEIKISGTIKEKGNGKEITDATIINASKREQYVNVDDKGHFQIQLEDSVEKIIVRSDNYYDKTIYLDDLEPNQENKIYLELLPDIVGSGVIRAKQKQEVSQTNLSQEELRYTAGSGGDAVKSVQTLPSVAPANVGSANIVVRGGNPGDNKYFYDDLRLPFVFHFGGVNTVIPTKMIDSVDFYPGGFSALYGNATGGIIQLNSKNSIPERFSGDIEAGLTQSGIYLEGNIFENKSDATTQTSQEDNRIGYRMGLRRTYYELYAPIINRAANIDFFTYPVSMDYQLVLDGKMKDGTWQVYMLGASDDVGILGSFGDSLDSSGKNSFSFSNYYETTGVKYNKNLGNGLGLQLSLQQLYNALSQSFSDNNINIKSYTYSLKTALTKNFSESHFLTIGIVPEYEINKI